MFLTYVEKFCSHGGRWMGTFGWLDHWWISPAPMGDTPAFALHWASNVLLSWVWWGGCTQVWSMPAYSKASIMSHILAQVHNSIWQRVLWYSPESSTTGTCRVLSDLWGRYWAHSGQILSGTKPDHSHEREKVRDLEKISPQAPEYTKVFNVRYMHALDAIFEDQQKELSGWITRAQEIKNELRNTTMELYLARQEGVRLRRKLAEKY